MRRSALVLLLIASSVSSALGADFADRSAILSERQFQERLRSIERPRDAAEQARLVNQLLLEGRYSSLQVKTMAKMFSHDDARYEFALAAFPRSVDPENFYEVYDAFTSFSKVMRLHDQVQPMRSSPPPATRLPLQPVSDEAMAEIMTTIHSEGLEDTRKAVVRQILTGRRRFLTRQIVEVVKAFAFDESRLDVAKLAYDFVIDPENLFLVNQAFSFPSTKESLTRYIESRRAEDARSKRR